MAAPKVTFQTCCSNFLMFGLIWATFLPGNVVFIMAIHPVSIILYILLCFYAKTSDLLPFWPPLSKTIETDPNLLYFSFFSPGWSMESVPIHYQSASYNSQTSEEYQLHSKPLIHGGIRSHISSNRKISLFWSFVACNCIPIWGYLQENNGQNHK